MRRRVCKGRPPLGAAGSGWICATSCAEARMEAGVGEKIGVIARKGDGAAVHGRNERPGTMRETQRCNWMGQGNNIVGKRLLD